MRKTKMMSALVALLLGLGSTALLAPAAQATEQEPHKSYVCKYVGTPGDNERLQTGQNPIFVDNHSIAGKDLVNVGDTFADAHGYSLVIVANTEKLDPEPGVSQCPLNPPEPKVDSEVVERMSCDLGVEERTVTTTTPYKYDYETNEWVLDYSKATEVATEWTFVRDLTQEERNYLECDPVVEPNVPLATITTDCGSARVEIAYKFGDDVEEQSKDFTVEIDGKVVWTESLMAGDDQWRPFDFAEDSGDHTIAVFYDGELLDEQIVHTDCVDEPVDPEDPKDPQEPNKPEEPKQPELPHTGGNLALGGIGAALLASGAGLMWAARNKRPEDMLG